VLRDQRGPKGFIRVWHGEESVHRCSMGKGMNKKREEERQGGHGMKTRKGGVKKKKVEGVTQDLRLENQVEEAEERRCLAKVPAVYTLRKQQAR